MEFFPGKQSIVFKAFCEYAVYVATSLNAYLVATEARCSQNARKMLAKCLNWKEYHFLPTCVPSLKLRPTNTTPVMYTALDNKFIQEQLHDMYLFHNHRCCRFVYSFCVGTKTTMSCTRPFFGFNIHRIVPILSLYAAFSTITKTVPTRGQVSETLALPTTE